MFFDIKYLEIYQTYWHINNKKISIILGEFKPCLLFHTTADYFSVLICKHITYSLDITQIFLLLKDNPAVKKKSAFIDLLDITSCNKSI